MPNHKEHSLSYWKRRVRRAQGGVQRGLDGCQKRVERMLPEILKSRFGGGITDAHVAQESRKLRALLEKEVLLDEAQLRSYILSVLSTASSEKRERMFLKRKTKALETAVINLHAKFRSRSAG